MGALELSATLPRVKNEEANFSLSAFQKPRRQRRHKIPIHQNEISPRKVPGFEAMDQPPEIGRKRNSGSEPSTDTDPGGHEQRPWADGHWGKVVKVVLAQKIGRTK